MSNRCGFSAGLATTLILIRCNSNCTAAGNSLKVLQLVSSLWTSLGVSGTFLICAQWTLYQIVRIDLSSSWDCWLVARQRYGKIGTIQLPSNSPSFRSSYIITVLFSLITAAVLAEICSALPLSGSIYIWAANAAGPKYSRFFGFIIAWWSSMSWITYAASNCQVYSSRDDYKNTILILLLYSRIPPITLFRRWRCGKYPSLVAQEITI